MKLKISGRIGAIFSGLTIILILCAGAGFFGARMLSNGLHFITETAWDAADGAMEGVISLQEQIISLNHLETIQDEQTAAPFIDSISESAIAANEALDRMIATGLFSEELANELYGYRQQFTFQRDQLLKIYSQYRANSSDIKMIAAKRTAKKQLDETAVRLLGFLEKLEATGDSKVENYTKEIAGIEASAYGTMLTMLVLGIGLATAAYFYVATTIVNSIRTIARQFLDISQGEGDLTVTMPEKGNDEITDVCRGFNLFVRKIRGTVQNILDSSNQLSAAAEELSQISNDTSRSLTQQQQETEMVATAMNEMVSTVQEVARNVIEAAESADAANNEASTGKSIVSGSINEIKSLATEVQQAAEVLSRLETDSENIGGVLDVIKDIADQTNLLALNAAIEAARAGEQGRGFAVVADEVRTLASRTQQSTEEIQTMIESLQAGAREAVEVMNRGKQRAESSVEQANNAGDALERITDAVAKITNMTAQIASAAEEQNAVAEEVNTSVVKISDMSQQTSNSSGQITTASGQLSQLASQLQSIVNQFKT